MKKLLLFALTLAATPMVKAQWMQNEHKTVVFIREWALCADSYNEWSVGLLDTLGDIQNTPGFPALMLQYDTGPAEGKTDLYWTESMLFSKNNSPNYGNQPAFAVDNIGVSILEFQYVDFYNTPAGRIYRHRRAIDTLYSYVSSLTGTPAVVSIGFTKTEIAPDSVVITAKTRFNVATTGTYMAAIYAVEDSAMGFMASTISADDTFAHRHFLRKAVQSGPWGWAVTYNTSMAAGEEYTRDYAYRIPASWNKDKLSYVMVVYKIDEVTGRKYIVNATNGVPASSTGVQGIKEDVTNNVKVYPVPAAHYVNVATDKTMEDCTVSLYDISGRKVAELYNGTMQAASPRAMQLPAGLAAGNYMLELHNEKVSAVKQVTVQ